MPWSIEVLDMNGNSYEPPLWYHGYGPDDMIRGSSVVGHIYEHEDEAMQAAASTPDAVRERIGVRRVAE